MSDQSNPNQDAINRIIEQYNKKLSAVLPDAVLSSIGLWGGVSIITVIAFNVLRPRNKIVYEPKVKYHVGDKQPPKLKDGFFDWLSPLIHTHEPVLLDKVGLDAVAFLRFIRMLRWLFLCVSVLACAVLLPINIVANNQSPSADKNSLSILTVQGVTGTFLYAHIVLVYVVTFLVFGFVWYNWRKMLELRLTWFRSDEYNKSFYARTLMILNVPKQDQSDPKLTALFQSLQIPYPTTSVAIGRRVGQLPELIEYHNEAVRELERVLVRYLHGGKIAKNRPTITIGGFLGIGGTKKDAIDFYTNKLKRTEDAIEEWRSKIDLKKAENYGFASMAAVPYAHIVAQMLEHKRPRGTHITLAPNPKDIIWKNLNMSDAERRTSIMFGWLWLGLATIVNIIPLVIVSVFANLSDVSEFDAFAFLARWKDSSPKTFSLANGIIPPTLSAIFSFFFPLIMRSISQYQGAVTNSRLDRAVVARYFAFLVYSQFFIFSLIGVAFKLGLKIDQQIKAQVSFVDILKDAKDLPEQIQSTYVSQSSYWLTFFPLRGFLVIFDLAQLLHLSWTWIRTRLFGRTPRDIREWTQPPNFEYAIYYSNILFMAVVGLIYAPLAPLVTLACMVVFWISSVVYKYQLMFVFVTSVESGGRLWNVVINRLLAGVIFMQMLMVATIGLALGWRDDFTWVATLPPILLTLLFKLYLSRTFVKQFRHFVPDKSELSNALVHSAGADHRGNKLEKRFGHPALQADLFTPMVHAKMMKLLPEVYHGRLASSETTMGEFGGQKMAAHVTAGGLKIAAISQRDLDVDPNLYGRDRGELDMDNRSIHHGKTSSFAGSLNFNAVAHQNYLAFGHGKANEFELERMDSGFSGVDRRPLLTNNQSEASSIYKGNGSRSGTPTPQWPGGPPAYASQASLISSEAPVYQAPPPMPTNDMRAAPIHRSRQSTDSLQNFPPRQRTPEPFDPRYQQPPVQYPPGRHQTPDPSMRGPPGPGHQQMRSIDMLPNRQRTPEPFDPRYMNQGRASPGPGHQQMRSIDMLPNRQRTPEPFDPRYLEHGRASPGPGHHPQMRSIDMMPNRQRTPEPFDPRYMNQGRGSPVPGPGHQQMRSIDMMPNRQRTPEPFDPRYMNQGRASPGPGHQPMRSIDMLPNRQRTPEPFDPRYMNQAPRQRTPDPYQQAHMGQYPPARPDPRGPGGYGRQ
jgi:hypothetical protein